LDLRRRQAMAGDVHDVVDAPQEPDVAVLVVAGAVTGEVDAVEAGPVRVLETLRIAVHPAQHRRPRLVDDEQPRLVWTQLPALVVDDFDGDARDRTLGRARLRLQHTGHGRDHVRARLRLPPRVDDGAVV